MEPLTINSIREAFEAIDKMSLKADKMLMSEEDAIEMGFCGRCPECGRADLVGRDPGPCRLCAVRSVMVP